MPVLTMPRLTPLGTGFPTAENHANVNKYTSLLGDLFQISFQLSLLPVVSRPATAADLMAPPEQTVCSNFNFANCWQTVALHAGQKTQQWGTARLLEPVSKSGDSITQFRKVIADRWASYQVDPMPLL